MPIILVATLVGALIGPLAHHIAVQSGADAPWDLAAAVCRRCATTHGHLAARCPSCGLAPTRVWLTTVGLAALSGAMAWRFGSRWVLVPYLLFGFLTVVLFLTDLDHKRIPNRITYPGTPSSALLLLAGAWLDGTAGAFPGAVAGAAVYSGFFFLVYLAARGGFGFGDVKLAVLLGLFLAFDGWERLLVAGFVTAAVGGVIALVAVVGLGAGAKTEIPYGPAMILGAWATVVGGNRFADLFL